jgi:uncharacterized protein YuzE
MDRNNMKITYDPDVDVLRILFSNTPIEVEIHENTRWTKVIGRFRRIKRCN